MSVDIPSENMAGETKMVITLLLAIAVYNAACSTSPHLATRDDDNRPENEGEQRQGDRDDDNDMGSGGSDQLSHESITPLISLRFSFLATDDRADYGLRYSKSSIPALRLAVEHINANSTILPGFSLSYNIKQLQVC